MLLLIPLVPPVLLDVIVLCLLNACLLSFVTGVYTISGWCESKSQVASVIISFVRCLNLSTQDAQAVDLEFGLVFRTHRVVLSLSKFLLVVDLSPAEYEGVHTFGKGPIIV